MWPHPAGLEHGSCQTGLYADGCGGGDRPAAPAKLQEKCGGDDTHLQIRAGDLSLLLGPVPQLLLVLQLPAPLRQAQTRCSWCRRYVSSCHRQKMLYFPAASGFLMSEADRLIDGV